MNCRHVFVGDNQRRIRQGLSTNLLRKYLLDIRPCFITRAEHEFPGEKSPAVHQLRDVLDLNGVRVEHPLRLRVEGWPVDET